MWTLPEFNHCEEVGADLLEAAFAPGGEPHPSQRVRLVLERMARVARPNSGAHRILVVLAKVAQADWIGGRLELTLSDFGVATEVDVRVDDGGQVSRWRSFSIAVPFSELAGWVKTWPTAIRPLAPYGELLADQLCLRARASSAPPSSVAADGAAVAPVSRVPSTRGGPRSDLHRRATVRLEIVALPSEAFPAHRAESSAEERDTARPPPPQPAAVSAAETDATDEGWE